MRVAIDYSSAVFQGAGVGRYTRSLVAALTAQLDSTDRLLLWYASRNRQGLDRSTFRQPELVEVTRIPLPARFATLAWQRFQFPVNLERFTGPIDVSHEPDFVAPPSKAPSIITIHDLSYLITPEFAYPKLVSYLNKAVPRTLNRASHIVTPSETTRRDVIQHYGVDDSRVTAVLNGVDVWFQPQSDAAITQATARFGLDAPYFLIVGTIEPRKNHLTLLRAFERLRLRHPEASLAILGSPGWLAEPIMAQIEATASRHPVRYLRYVDDSWLPALYAGSVALVYPSWYEGFGLPAVEAMASGTAVITSDRGALPEVVGTATIVTPPDDEAAICAAMESLLESPVRRAQLIQAGLAWARQFSWERAARDLLAIYRAEGGGP